jgi:hypothetical protein
MDDPQPPDYERGRGPPGTVEIVDEEAYDADSESDTNEWGVQAQVSFSPKQVESLCHLCGRWVAGIVGSVLATALVTVYLL